MGVVVTECQSKALHDGKYNVEGVKNIDTCKIISFMKEYFCGVTCTKLEAQEISCFYQKDLHFQ